MLSKSLFDILMGLFWPVFFSKTFMLINNDADALSAAEESLLK
jgi:hypothetical protein